MANDQFTVQVRIAGTNALTPAVGQATQSLRGLTQEAGRTNTAMNQLKTVGMGLFAGVSAAGVVRMAEDLYATGMAAQRAGNLFRSFGAQIGDTDAVLARMRETTRGVVTDVELMNAANSMLSMGLAKNADDVERLTNIGVTFAQAMGDDVGASLENLNMILANQSYLRLDSLGISSSQVRELAEGYRRAGMDSSEAFNAAFLEVAEGKLPQMAAVADATVTEIQKLRTSMDNWWVDFGDRFAQGVNGLIGIATNGGQIIRAALFGQESVWAGNEANANPAWAEAARGVVAGRTSGQTNWTAEQIASVIGLAQSTGRDVGSLSLMDLRMVSGQPLGFDSQYLQLQHEALTTLGILASQQQTAQFLSDNAELIAQRAAESGPLAGDWRDRIGGRGSAAFEFDRVMRGFQWAQSSAALSGAGAGVGDMNAVRRDRLRNPFSVWYGVMQADLDRGASLGGVQIFSDEDVRKAETVLSEIERLFETAQNTSLFSGQELENMKRMRDFARGMADSIQAGADALAGMSLSQLFGQTSGGRLGEIDAALLDQLAASGASDATLEAMRTALGLDSGQLTELSQQFETEVIPQLAAIATQYGTEAVVTARTAYEAALQAAGLAGQTAPLDLAGVLGYEQWATPGQFGSQFTVNPGDTPSAVAARTGMTVDQVLAATGARDSRSMPVGTFGGAASAGFSTMVPVGFEPTEWATAGLGMETSMANAETSASGITTEMQTAVDTLSTGLDNAFAKPYRAEIALDVTEINVTPAFRSALTQIVAEIVRANGGTTPGQSAGTGRSTRTSD